MFAAVSVLSLFAALWALIGLISAGFNGLVIAVPLSLSLAVMVMGWIAQNKAPPDPQDARRIRRTVRIWSAVEFALIAAAIFLLGRLKLPQYVVPAICAIVGLHFFPLARGIPLPLYNWTGVALVAVAAAWAAMPVPLAFVIAPLLAAAILWGTAAVLIVTANRKAKAQAGS
jgi:hypothetical protein